MNLRLRLNKNRLATLNSSYPPTFEAEKDIEEYFYSQLDQVLTAVPKEDKSILLEHFNAI